jgi:hypothetical protein
MVLEQRSEGHVGIEAVDLLKRAPAGAASRDQASALA